MINRELYKQLEEEFNNLGNRDSEIINASSVLGGSINDCYKVQTAAQTYFVKFNSAVAYPQMFEKEAMGLKILQEANAIKIPDVYAYGEVADRAYLILEFIDSSSKEVNFWENFGRQLAQLHQVSAEYFGLDEDNYIGSLKQYNNKKEDWNTFFIEQRLMPQLEMAINKGLLETNIIKDFEILFEKLDGLFPIEKSSLLHGDLWSGNFMVGESGEPVIMDPAVYFGHREMDIAMTKLFGGFHLDFYKAYNEAYPLENGWEDRIQLCNLYPLLVHVNLFAGSYIGQLKSILSSFI